MAEPPTTRSSLLIRIRDAHDTAAWGQFVGVYAPLVYGYFRRRGLQDADAADLTQDVLRAVAAQAPRFQYDRKRGTFRGWLYGVARNKLRDFLATREQQPQGNGDSTTLELIQSLPVPDTETAEWEREYEERVFAWAAEQVRVRVDDSTWQAFWLTAVEGKSGQETARLLGMSVGAVYVAKSRVLARLKRQVEQVQEE
jgi:RNA polymerase sigma-70 factor (ECF subfamily)